MSSLHLPLPSGAAAVQESQGRAEEAIATSRRAMAVLKACVGVECPEFLQCLLRCGRLQLAAGRLRDAHVDLDLAFTIHCNVKGSMCLAVAATADLLVRCCRELGDAAAALSWAKRAADIRVAALGPDSDVAVAALDVVAQLEARQE